MKTRTDADVDALLAKAKHPLAAEIDVVRAWLLSASGDVVEAVKWNTASYRTTDFFAAIHLRSTDSVQVVLHMGAKAKSTAQTGLDIQEPEGLCRWLAKDRCLVTLGKGTALKANRARFVAFVREWLKWVELAR